LLIASQKPEASNVAGIFTWNQLGRRVKKGEKGIMIFAPMIAKKRRQKSSEEREESDSKTMAGPALVGFRPVYVWDISQTEGKELPALREFSGEAGKHLAQLVQFVIGRGIKFGYTMSEFHNRMHPETFPVVSVAWSVDWQAKLEVDALRAARVFLSLTQSAT
jgi:hypothetical protein